MLARRLVSLSRAHFCRESYSSQLSRQQVYHLWQIFSRSDRSPKFCSKSVIRKKGGTRRSPRERSPLTMGQGSSNQVDPDMAQKYVDDKVAQNKVMVFSKSYCPYCKMAKDVFREVGVQYGLVELDERDDGDAIQDYLKKITGARSVPRVFINGKCIGGGSETRALHDQGKLIPMLKDCGAL